ncbi:MAG TPA: DUF1552 domain-containing protein [Enhygromyxa sp.]|nr:DUF1552 domain-containing protein [Enhygromyxa sp.]
MTRIKRLQPLSRRTVLRGLGGAAIALPMLDAMRGRPARALEPKPPRRLIIMYTPNGTIAHNFWPKGAGADFTLSPILTPLAPYKKDLLILRGIDMLSSLDGPGDAHQKGTGQCLTATPLLEGDFAGDAGQSAGWAGGVSIDQRVANHFGAATPFASLEFGVAVQGSTVSSRISYRGAGQPLPPENSPYAGYRRLFADALRDPVEVERLATRRRTVLDAVADQHRALRDRLGAEDRIKLENHLLAVEEIRARLDQPTMQFEGVCQPLDQNPVVEPDLVANMPTIGRLQMDLLAMALACDLTRVATLMWTQSAAGPVYSFLDPAIIEGHHSIAHKGDEDHVKVAQNTKINTWFAEQLAYLIGALRAIPEDDGSVFDNTVILWTNEQAKGNNHDRRDMPYVLAGSAGGYFDTGRYLVQGQQTGHNKLLVSLLHAMGIDEDEFGDPKYGKGPLSGLT